MPLLQDGSTSKASIVTKDNCITDFKINFSAKRRVHWGTWSTCYFHELSTCGGSSGMPMYRDSLFHCPMVLVYFSPSFR